VHEPADEPPLLLRAVLDTNVYVSGTILSRGTPFEVLEAWRRQAYILVTSEAILVEIEDRYAVAEPDITRLVASLRADALIVPGDYPLTGVCADPDDDKFLACALEAQASCIVSGDPDLLDLSGYQGMAILKPHEFLERLRTRASRS